MPLASGDGDDANAGHGWDLPWQRLVIKRTVAEPATRPVTGAFTRLTHSPRVADAGIIDGERVVLATSNGHNAYTPQRAKSPWLVLVDSRLAVAQLVARITPKRETLARAIGRRKAVHRACRHSGDAVCAKLVDVCGGEGPDRLGEKAVALISVAELAAEAGAERVGDARVGKDEAVLLTRCDGNQALILQRFDAPRRPVRLLITMAKLAALTVAKRKDAAGGG